MSISRNPKLIKYQNEFWQPVTLVDNEGVEYGSGNPIPVSAELNITDLDVRLKSADNELIEIQNPLQVSGDSVHLADVDFTNSDFTGWTGNPIELFKSPFSESITKTTGNPKTIIIGFNRTIKALQIGLGENNGGDFSNIKISLLGSGGAERALFDKSSDNTKLTSLNAQFNNELFNSVKIEFFTNDAVSISNITIQKATYNTSQIQGLDNQGNFRVVKTTGDGKLKVDFPRDIFGNLPIAEQFSLTDQTRIFEQFIPLFWTDYINGAGASNVYDKSTSKNTLSVTSNGEIAATQMKTRQKYQALKAHKGAYTGLLSKEVGVEKYVGLADLDDYNEPVIDGTIRNGVVFCVTENDIFIQLYNNGIREVNISQAFWNIDKLDGNGFSGFTLDLSKAQIFINELEWLGVGAILFALNINGINIPIHQINNANFRVEDVYMRTANLSPLYMIRSVGGSGSMKCICTAVVSGGGHNPTGVPRTVYNENPVSIASGNKEFILAIRLKPESYEANVEVRGFSAIVASSGDSIMRLHYNPAWDGGNITWTDLPNSHIQYGTSDSENNNITDDGIIMGQLPISIDSDSDTFEVNSKLKLGKNLQSNANQEGRYDVIVLSGEALNSSEIYNGSISFIDII